MSKLVLTITAMCSNLNVCSQLRCNTEQCTVLSETDSKYVCMYAHN